MIGLDDSVAAGFTGSWKSPLSMEFLGQFVWGITFNFKVVLGVVEAWEFSWVGQKSKGRVGVVGVGE